MKELAVAAWGAVTEHNPLLVLNATPFLLLKPPLDKPRADTGCLATTLCCG